MAGLSKLDRYWKEFLKTPEHKLKEKMEKQKNNNISQKDNNGGRVTKEWK